MFAESFKLYLRAIHDRQNSYINRALTWLNRLIYIAIDQEVLRSNPLEDVRYQKKDPPKHRHINKSDLKSIMENSMPDERLELVRRAFIFSSLTGLAYVDMHRLYPQHIGKTAVGSAGLSIESIAKMMEHANITTIQVYAQITEQKISEDIDKLMERKKTI